jgi:hypothetical protein
MQATASADDHRDVRREPSSKSSRLDERYGKIGIRAVAGAVRCKGDERKAVRTRLVPNESD